PTSKGTLAWVAGGWFARKVHSIAAGIAFGLAVNLLLAWLVAFMQHGYYLEIMLPGACVGAIVGWATQRYGQPAGTAGPSISCVGQNKPCEIFRTSLYLSVPDRCAP